MSTPQARGRRLARLAAELWERHATVSAVATELMASNPDVPSIQAYRYAAGLSQDQAARRYNAASGHHTSVGATTINAWESWARRRGAGSPPSLASLILLAVAYSKGPDGRRRDSVSPGDLVADVYERLPPDDQAALKSYVETVKASRDVVDATRRPNQQIGQDFTLEVPTVEFGNPEICVFTLPNPRTGELLDLTWPTFGFGIERLARQIKNVGRRLDVDLCVGVNEAGLVMGTFLASAQLGRSAVGYVRCTKVRDEIMLSPASLLPSAPDAPVILVCDFEVKHADVIGFVAQELRARYPGAQLHFAVFGAMTKEADLAVASFDDLTGADIMRAAGLTAVFIAATMAAPGIEPPLELR